MRHVRDDGLPIVVAKTFALEDYPVLGFVVMTAASAREALARVVRFHSILSPSARWSIEEKDDVVRIHWHREGPRTLGHRVANVTDAAIDLTEPATRGATRRFVFDVLVK